MAQADLKPFLDFASPLTKQANGVLVSALLLKTKNGFHVISGRVTTLDTIKDRGVRRYKEAGCLIGISICAGRKEVEPVLHALETGQLLLPGSPGPSTAVLAPHSQFKYLWTDKRFVEVNEAKRKYGTGWPAHVALVEGGMLMLNVPPEDAERTLAEVSKVGGHLASDSPPYPNLLSLCHDLGVFRYDSLEAMSRTWLELVVPIRIRLNSVDVDPVAKKLIVIIDSEGRIGEDTKVAVMPARATPSQKSLVKANTFRSVGGPSGVRRRSFPLPRQPGSLTVSLSLGRTTIDSLITGVHDPRRIAHVLVDAQGERLKSWLFEPASHSKKPQNNFELAVSWLFHLLGFAVVQYGVLGQCADLLATSASGRLVLVLECSIALPDRHKLKNLRHRRDALRNLYADNEIGSRVTPVLITCAESSLLDIKQAEEDGILLIEGDRLEELFEELLQGYTHSFFVKKLEELAKECDPEDPLTLAKKYSGRMLR